MGFDVHCCPRRVAGDRWGAMYLTYRCEDPRAATAPAADVMSHAGPTRGKLRACPKQGERRRKFRTPISPKTPRTSLQPPDYPQEGHRTGSRTRSRTTLDSRRNSCARAWPYCWKATPGDNGSMTSSQDLVSRAEGDLARPICDPTRITAHEMQESWPELTPAEVAPARRSPRKNQIPLARNRYR